VNRPVHLPWDWYPDPLPANVKVGERSWIYSSFAFLHHRSEASDAVVIGADSGLYEGTAFLTGRRGRVSIGDFCAVVGAIFATNGSVTVGSYALIAHGVVFADEGFPSPESLDRSAGAEIAIAENVWIGAQATVVGDCRIGEGAVIGALAVVTCDIPGFAIAAGNPARVVGSVDRAT
jgi:acetyltransferase-like isoleucine patch superfamily enzyme